MKVRYSAYSISCSISVFDTMLKVPSPPLLSSPSTSDEGAISPTLRTTGTSHFLGVLSVRNRVLDLFRRAKGRPHRVRAVDRATTCIIFRTFCGQTPYESRTYCAASRHRTGSYRLCANETNSVTDNAMR